MSGFRLIQHLIGNLHLPGARQEVVYRVARALRNISEHDACRTPVNICYPTLFVDIEAAGYASTSLVYSAFVELCRYVACQLKGERSRLQTRSGCSRDASPMSILLSLLQTLMAGLSPCLVNYAVEILSVNQTGRVGDSNTTATSLTPHSEQPIIAMSNSWPDRTSRTNSMSLIASDADEASLITDARATVDSVFASVLPMLGDILGDEGDIMSGSLCDFGANSGQGTVHHAAWKTLTVITMQILGVCSGASCMRGMERTDSLMHGTLAGTGRPGSRSTDHAKHGSAGGVPRWWGSIHLILSVLFAEAKRTQERLEVLQRDLQADERVTKATKARYLVAAPTLLPFSSTWLSFAGSPDYKDGPREFSITFWVWIPDAMPPKQPTDACEESNNGGGCTEDSKSSSRTAIPISNCSLDTSPGDGETAYWGRRHLEVELTRLRPCDRGNTAGSANSRDAVYVKFAVSNHASETSEKPARLNHATDSGSDDRHSTTASVLETRHLPEDYGDSKNTASDSTSPVDHTTQNNDTDHHGPVATDWLVSDVALPSGRWVNVCCSYSQGQGPSERSLPDETSGASSPQLEVTIIRFNGCMVAKQVQPSPQGTGRGSRSQGCFSERRKLSVEIRRDSEDACALLPGRVIQCKSAVSQGIPAVCDVRWHLCSVSEDQARDMTSRGVPRKLEEERRAADNYAIRLSSLAHEIALSSKRAAAALSSSPWLPLWFKLVELGRRQVQRAVLAVLRPLLSVADQSGDREEVGSGDPKAIPPGDYTSLWPHGSEFPDRAIINYLCALLGKNLLSLRVGSPFLDGEPNESARGHTVQTSSPNRELPSYNEEESLNTPATLLRKETCITSDIVLLLRALVVDAPTRWQRHMSAVLEDGLVSISNEESILSARIHATPCIKEAGKIQDDNSDDESNRSFVKLGAALASVYLGGGHVERPRLEGKVTVVPNLSSCLLNGYPIVFGSVSPEALTNTRPGRYHAGCNQLAGEYPTQSFHSDSAGHMHQGTVVGWTMNKEVADPTFARAPDSCGTGNGCTMLLVAIDKRCWGKSNDATDIASSPRTLLDFSMGCNAFNAKSSVNIVAVPSKYAVWRPAIDEPDASFLFEGPALAAVHSLLDLSTLRKECGGMSPGESGSTRGHGMRTRTCNLVVSTHVRSRLARAIAVQLGQTHQALAAMRGGVLPLLLALSATKLQLSIAIALGPEGAVTFSRRPEFTPVLFALDNKRGLRCNPRSLLSDLEAATEMVWSRINAGDDDRRYYEKWTKRRNEVKVKGGNDHNRSDSRFPRSLRPTLQVLDGDALVEGNRVTASSHFPTVHLPGVGTDLQCAGGRWYYEMTLLTGGLMQVGWAGPQFQCSPVHGQGVGDHRHSWAFDGFRQKRWCVSSTSYGQRWRAGDVVGVLLDAVLREMRFRYKYHCHTFAMIVYHWLPCPVPTEASD